MIRFFAALLVMAMAACEPQSPRFDTESALASIKQGAVLIDVRSTEEFAEGHFEGAVNIPHTEIVSGLKQMDVAKDTPVVLYCRSGSRSAKALADLQQSGFSKVQNAGGLKDLQRAANNK